MQLTTVDTGAGVHLAVAGELGPDTAARLSASLVAATDRSDSVVLDLSGVTLLGSDALRALVQAQGRCTRTGRRLRVASVSTAVLVAFARAGVRWARLAPIPTADVA